MNNASCEKCKHSKPYKGVVNVFWCDYLGGLIYWESVRKRPMCGEEGFESNVALAEANTPKKKTSNRQMQKMRKNT